MAREPGKRPRAEVIDEIAAGRRTSVVFGASSVVPEAIQRQADSSARLGALLDDLEEAATSMRLWSGRSAEYVVDRIEKYKADRRDFEKLVARAIRADWLDHPYVRNWIAEQRSLGEWDVLRTFSAARLERGVQKPMLKADFWLAMEANEPIRQGKRPEAIRRLLIAKLMGGVPEPYFDLSSADVKRLQARLKKSRQNFHQWLTRVVGRNGP